MKYDLIIIGSGPAGYVAAIRAGQTGLKTLVIDKRYIGGMCLNWGCIPSKTWLESAKLYNKIVKQSADFGITGVDAKKIGFDWKQARKRSSDVIAKLSRGIEFLWKKNGVEFLKAEAKIISPTEVEADKQIFETKHILIATGSRPAELDGMKKVLGVEALANSDSLPEKPIIWGEGPVAYEMLQFFQLLGREPVLALTGEVLLPELDESLQSFVQRKLKKEKVTVVPAQKIRFDGEKAFIDKQEIEYDTILNCSLRKAVLPKSKVELQLKDGFIEVNHSFQSSIPNIYAAGDVNGKSYLAHAASSQGLAVIDHIHGRNLDVDALELMPINIYSDPEIAQIGKTESQLKAEGVEYMTQQYSLAANGKALAEGASEGYLRLIYEPKYSQVLGVQIVASNATDMIAEAALLLEMEGTVYDLATAIHAHPTVSEVFMDAGSQAVSDLEE
ncbi:MAG: NAD(P)/FAD-dependent oxidoreductase [Candidatus Cloacimonetes bacterium]|nr:NAD(P)/FAD-dependent oxidoreductase [Candidatus Cloacimonadota bacterium]